MNAVIEEKLKSFFIKYNRRSYDKGEFLIWPGDEPRDVFFLKSGIVIEYIISNKGNEGILSFYSPRDVFPLTLVNDAPNDHYFEALFPTQAYRAPFDEFMVFAKHNADVLFALFQQNNKELDDLKTRMTYSMAGDAYAKLVHEILLIARYEGKKDEETGSTQINQFAERSAAARTGLTVETVSREMKKLKSKKLVDFHRNILVIYDIALLEKELEDY